MLEGQQSELQPHAGHQIEVTGTLDTTRGSTSGATPPSATGTTGSGTTGSASGTTTSGSSSTTDKAQWLRVTSVRMISATCPSK